MNNLDKSLSLMKEFFQETPNDVVSKMFDDVKNMFSEDILFDDYICLINETFTPKLEEIYYSNSINNWRDLAMQLQPDTVVLNCVAPQMINDQSDWYNPNCKYNHAA